MELQSFSFPLLLAFIIFFYIVIKNEERSNTNKPTPRLPPGPWKLPVIGSLHHLLVGSLPHQCLRDLAKKHGSLVHVQLGEVSYIVVSSPETAKEVMNTHDVKFAQRPSFLAPRIISYGSTNIIFSPYGGYWRQLRKICTAELLSSGRVQSFRLIREEEVSNLIKLLSSGERAPINLTKKIFSLTYGITSRAAFGRKTKDQEEFISVVKELIELGAGFSIADVYPSLEAMSGMRPKLEKRRRQTDRILGNIINEHRERRTMIELGNAEAEDLVDVLLKLQESDLKFPISDDNIKAVIMDIFSAGSDTSSTTLDWAMSEMLKHPNVMKKAQAEVRQVFHDRGSVDEERIHELKFLKSVIKETLRLHPSVPLIPRKCREHCKIDGWEIPAKTRVIVNAWAIGRDPKYWTEAERFIPERFLNNPIDYKGTEFEYIPFGSGRRICPGISFGLANIELPLAQLLYHFDWELPVGMKLEDLNMTEAAGATVRRKEETILIPIPYHQMPFSGERKGENIRYCCL